MTHGRLAVTALAAVVILAVQPVLASGFSIFEQDARASGQAGAWVARADGAAGNWYNPAALVRQEGMQLEFGTQLITVGKDTKLTTSDPAFGLTGSTTFKTKETDQFPSHLYFAQRLGNRMAWGVGVNTPFGLVTEWKDQPITFSSRKANLVTYVVNPNVSFAINERWSVAAGLDWIYADVREFSRDVNTGTGIIGRVNMKGNGTDMGWNIATHYTAREWGFGLTYRAEMSPKIDGNIDFSNFGALSALFPSGPAHSRLDLPAQAAIGISWAAMEDWQFEFDIAWAGWSSFQSLPIHVDNPFPPFVTDVTQREDWSDTYSYRFGAGWKLSDAHELRFGAVFDQNPIPDDTLRPSIPDADRWSPTVGYGYHGQSFSLDAYYMPLFFTDRTSAGDPADGVIDGKYTSSVHLIGFTVGFKF